MWRNRGFVRISAAVLWGIVALLGSTSTIGADRAADTADWQTYSNAKAGLSFRYPRDWVVDDEGFDETAGGSRASVRSLTLYREGNYDDSDNWIRFNPRQSQDEDGQCVEVSGNQICTYSSDERVLEVYRGVARTAKPIKRKGGA